MTPSLSLSRRIQSPALFTLLWQASLVLMAAAHLVCAHWHTIADNDLWGHVRFGLDMLEARSLHPVDLYSFTAHGAPWINHEWLAEVVMALTWKFAGAAGLVWLKIAIALTTIAICARHLRRQDLSPAYLATAICPWIAIIPNFTVLRPLHFTLPFFAALLVILYETSRGETRKLWLLTPLFALWVNFHGGVLAGAAVLLIWTATLALFDRPRLRSAWMPALCAILATLINPYGWKLLHFLVTTATVHRPEITEWAPMRATSMTGFLYLPFAAMAVFGFAKSRLAKPVPLILTFAAIASLPFAAVRHVTLAVVAVIVLAGPHAADALRQVSDASRKRPGRGWRVPAWGFLVPLALSVLLLTVLLSQPPRVLIKPDLFPVRAVQVLAASGVQGNLINRFNWGEYVIWHLGPELKVTMDGRRETVYPPALYEHYLAFQDGKEGWDWILRNHPGDVALLERHLPSASLMRLLPDWEVMYEDDLAIILARRGSSASASIRAAIPRVATTSPPYFFP